jgi:selenocysteine lyase/cysteine desulfurase
VTSRTTLVAVSAVQSADGRVADLDALHAASRATGARVLLDTTGRHVSSRHPATL